MKKTLFAAAVFCASFCVSSVSCSKADADSPQKTQNQLKKEDTMPVQSKTLTIESNSKSIYAIMHAPDDTEKHPAVICSHGFNGSGDDFTADCLFDAQRGFVALSYDFSGGSARSRSRGKSTDMTLFTEKEDLQAVFAFVQSMDSVLPGSIFLMGASQGGMVTALCAEELQGAIKGVTLYFPAFCIPDDWRKKLPDTDSIPDKLNFWGLDLGKDFFVSIHDFYTFDSIGGYEGNVLIIHGDKDPVVPLSYSQEAQKLYKHAELEVLPGEGHGFSPAGGEKARALVADFMQAQLHK